MKLNVPILLINNVIWQKIERKKMIPGTQMLTKNKKEWYKMKVHKNAQKNQGHIMSNTY